MSELDEDMDTVSVYKMMFGIDKERAAYLLGQTEGQAEAYNTAVLMENRQEMRNARDRLREEVNQMESYADMMIKKKEEK